MPDTTLIHVVTGTPTQVRAIWDAIALGTEAACPRGHWRGPLCRTQGPYRRCPLCLEPTKPEGQAAMRALFNRRYKTKQERRQNEKAR